MQKVGKEVWGLEGILMVWRGAGVRVVDLLLLWTVIEGPRQREGQSLAQV